MQELTVPASLKSLSTIGQFIMNVSKSSGLEDASAYRLRLAIDEIATNAIHYGKAGARGPASLTVRVEASQKMLTVTLEDYGSAFDPRTQPAPDGIDKPLEEREVGGLGVFLALRGVDGFDYQRDGERNRNIFMMNRPCT
jgi:anti-sigma regulatory factor (Ser/Thr protein kinase)